MPLLGQICRIVKKMSATLINKGLQTISNGAPGGVRIPNLWFRRPTLYPIELQAHVCFFQNKIIIRGCEAFVNKNMNNWQKF